MASIQAAPPPPSPQRSGPTATAAPAQPATPDYAAGLTDADRFSRRRTFLVGLILTSVILATLGMVTFIWYRWHGVQEPTTAIIINGDASLDGTVITVRGGLRQISTTLKQSNSYTAVLLVEPGNYWVQATQNGTSLLLNEVQVKRFLGVQFNLPDFLRAQQKAAERGETLQLSAEPPPPTSP